MKRRICALLLLPLLAVAAEREPPPTVAAALAQAQREHVPLFVDFQAQWCYSCYFMATHVLTGAQWDDAADYG